MVNFIFVNFGLFQSDKVHDVSECVIGVSILRRGSIMNCKVHFGNG